MDGRSELERKLEPLTTAAQKNARQQWMSHNMEYCGRKVRLEEVWEGRVVSLLSELELRYIVVSLALSQCRPEVRRNALRNFLLAAQGGGNGDGSGNGGKNTFEKRKEEEGTKKERENEEERKVMSEEECRARAEREAREAYEMGLGDVSRGEFEGDEESSEKKELWLNVARMEGSKRETRGEVEVVTPLITFALRALAAMQQLDKILELCLILLPHAHNEQHRCWNALTAATSFLDEEQKASFLLVCIDRNTRSFPLLNEEIARMQPTGDVSKNARSRALLSRLACRGNCEALQQLANYKDERDVPLITIYAMSSLTALQKYQADSQLPSRHQNQVLQPKKRKKKEKMKKAPKERGGSIADNLNADSLCLIFQHLDVIALARIRLVSRHWSSVSMNDFLWRKMYRQHSHNEPPPNDTAAAFRSDCLHDLTASIAALKAAMPTGALCAIETFPHIDLLMNGALHQLASALRDHQESASTITRLLLKKYLAKAGRPDSAVDKVRSIIELFVNTQDATQMMLLESLSAHRGGSNEYVFDDVMKNLCVALVPALNAIPHVPVLGPPTKSDAPERKARKQMEARKVAQHRSAVVLREVEKWKWDETAGLVHAHFRSRKMMDVDMDGLGAALAKVIRILAEDGVVSLDSKSKNDIKRAIAGGKKRAKREKTELEAAKTRYIY